MPNPECINPELLEVAIPVPDVLIVPEGNPYPAQSEIVTEVGDVALPLPMSIRELAFTALREQTVEPRRGLRITPGARGYGGGGGSRRRRQQLEEHMRREQEKNDDDDEIPTGNTRAKSHKFSISRSLIRRRRGDH